MTFAVICCSRGRAVIFLSAVDTVVKVTRSCSHNKNSFMIGMTINPFPLILKGGGAPPPPIDIQNIFL